MFIFYTILESLTFLYFPGYPDDIYWQHFAGVTSQDVKKNCV
jgi:hypothetical protein